MKIDLKKEFALRNKLIKQFEESTNMDDKQIADFTKLMQLQDNLLEILALQLESAADKLEVRDEHIKNLDAQLTKHEKMLDEVLSLTRKNMTDL